jgi:hypothetical protein
MIAACAGGFQTVKRRHPVRSARSYNLSDLAAQGHTTQVSLVDGQRIHQSDVIVRKAIQ